MTLSLFREQRFLCDALRTAYASEKIFRLPIIFARSFKTVFNNAKYAVVYHEVSLREYFDFFGVEYKVSWCVACKLGINSANVSLKDLFKDPVGCKRSEADYNITYLHLKTRPDQLSVQCYRSFSCFEKATE